MKFGKRLIENGAVTLRRNTEGQDNLDYSLTDWHGNRYEVADERELREIRDVINQYLGEDN